MRCALQFEADKDLTEQEVNAWGEMQSLEEEPSYREADIEGEKEKGYFLGFKSAFDFFCNLLDNLVEDEVITNDISDEIQSYMPGELAMQLFSILDNQEE